MSDILVFGLRIILKNIGRFSYWIGIQTTGLT